MIHLLKGLFLKKFLKYLFFVFLIWGTLVGLYACLIEPFRLVVTDYTVKTSKWNSDKPLKIILLTDLHSISPWMTPSHTQDIVDKANSLDPDVILLLGDYVGDTPFGKQINPDEGVAPLKNLKSKCGTFAVLGNHDFFGPLGWPQALKRTGIPVLRNAAQKIDCDGQSFWVAGLDELWWGHSDITKTLAQVRDENPVILMMHNPDSFPVTPDRVALSIAGHTHGGQIRFPFIGSVPAVVPSKYGSRYDRGHFIEDGKDLVVSSGLGMTGIPLRFLCPPEITVVTLSRE